MKKRKSCRMVLSKTVYWLSNRIVYLIKKLYKRLYTTFSKNFEKNGQDRHRSIICIEVLITGPDLNNGIMNLESGSLSEHKLNWLFVSEIKGLNFRFSKWSGSNLIAPFCCSYSVRSKSSSERWQKGNAWAREIDSLHITLCCLIRFLDRYLYRLLHVKSLISFLFTSF